MPDDTPHSSPTGEGTTRRTVLKGAAAALGVAALGGALTPLREAASKISAAEFLQKHYKELTPEEKQSIIERLEAEAREEHGIAADIRDPRPIPGTKFGYALNLSLCNGNGKCAEACYRENNHDSGSRQSYIRILEMPNGTFELGEGTTEYDHPVPRDRSFYLPVQCQQCDNPPCVDVCPVEATWKEEDGIVVIDYNWCIGCRYCEAACPYHARRFNWQEPTVDPQTANANQGYLSNRVRPQGVVEKCHFCLHRTREGRLPACLEACPNGARVFGNLLDPDSEIRWVLDHKRVFVLKEELGTRPSFFYFFDV